MTDAAKSDGQVAWEAYHLQEHKGWPASGYLLWDGLAAAVVANAAPRIRAEMVEQVIAHQIKKFRVIMEGEQIGDGLQAEFDKADNELRALAAAPPGFVCVPVSMVKFVAKLNSGDQFLPDLACVECVPKSTALIPGWKCSIHLAQAMLAESGK
jgi:hypothetical protein